jgi:phosphoserine phosphatase RsbU/P
MTVRALIADDDRGAAAMLAKALRGWSIEPTVAHDGEEAWQRLGEGTPPSLAILDWMMPRLDGLDLCRRIRGRESLAAMYVIVLTGRPGSDNLVAGLDAGADDYIVKPFDRDELRARIGVGLRVLGLQQRVADRVAELQAALSQVKRLTGLLPICSYCKRIRGDQDYWEQVESYITQHSEAQFSHGICPECFDTVCKQFDE